MDNVIITLILIFVTSAFAFIFGHVLGESNIRQQAIEKEYALYCPKTGEFAWKGECVE